MWRIEFESDKFLPFLPEESQGNPGVYGFELATWLSRSLAQRGLVATYPLGEDWGWLLEHFQDELEVAIGCSSVCGEGEGYFGKPVSWSIFVDPRTSLKQKLKGVSGGPVEKALVDHISAILQAEGITWTVVE
jgi:hypothetical protein